MDGPLGKSLGGPLDEPLGRPQGMPKNQLIRLATRPKMKPVVRSFLK